MQSRIANYFGLELAGTTFRREVLAGVTTFVTMSYIIAVNPAIMKAAGIPEGPSMVATVMTAVLGTLVMGLYANRPFAIAPYMGENAFVAYTVVKVLGYSWQTAMAAVFLAGVMFALLTVARVRQWMVEALPPGLCYSFGVGIGLFLSFIGLNESGIVALGVAGAPVRIGNLAAPSVEIAVLSFVLIAVLMVRRVPGAILLGILISAGIAFVTGVAKPPSLWVSMPPNPAPIMLKLDLRGALSVRFFGVLLTIFVMALIDTMGSLIGVSARAGFLDADGTLPQIERPMLADAIATMFAGLVGTTTSGAYIESAAGIHAGGRTGLTAVVVAALFAMSLFFAPLVAAIPAAAYAPALIVVGAMMIAPVVKIDFDDYTELIPAFTVIALMSFTYNIGIGITAGLILYPLVKLATGRRSEVHAGLWLLCGLSILFYVFYPYQ
ncbi:MAG: NCS2 family permease [Candidatus Binatus sp.]|uniref:NCS2 family permease n=1 Tax=Candidatus Binatus sp. TaxID=2811406 RepID=UPI003C720EC0